MIYFNKRANDIKVFGDEVNNNQTSPFGISGEITNFDTKFLNLVIFFKSSEFFYESSDFCKEACGSTTLSPGKYWHGCQMEAKYEDFHSAFFNALCFTSFFSVGKAWLWQRGLLV